MRKRLDNVVLTTPEVRVFRKLIKIGQASVSDLAAAADRSVMPAWVSVGKLAGKGLVDVAKIGNRKVVGLSENTHAQTLAGLLSAHPEIPWEKVLAYSPSALYIESTGIGISLPISKWARSFARRRLSGMGMRPDTQSEITDTIREFFNEYVKFMSRKFVGSIVPKGAAVVWQRGYSAIIRISADHSPGPGFEETGTTAIAKLGLPFISDYDYYYYEPRGRRLAIEAALVHAILVDPESPTVAMYVLLAAAKSEKVDWERVLEEARLFGIKKRMQEIKDFWESSGSVRGRRLPVWGELLRLAEMYGVHLR